mgnify:CR=1 FL=1
MTERLWFKIGDAARLVGVSPKELRYWERVIPEIRPRRSQGNLRYYHAEEIPRLERIHAWLQEGLTVADCRELLRTGQLARGLDLGLEPEELPRLAAPPARRSDALPVAVLKPVLKALRGLALRLSKPPRP